MQIYNKVQVSNFSNFPLIYYFPIKAQMLAVTRPKVERNISNSDFRDHISRKNQGTFFPCRSSSHQGGLQEKCSLAMKRKLSVCVPVHDSVRTRTHTREYIIYL